MTFQTTALTAFASASAAALSGGSIDILDAGGVLLWSKTLGSPAGSASSGLLVFSGFPNSSQALSTGPAASVRLRTSTGAVYKSGITVGIVASGAQVIIDNGAASLLITTGQTVVMNSASLNHAST